MCGFKYYVIASATWQSLRRARPLSTATGLLHSYLAMTNFLFGKLSNQFDAEILF